MKLRAGAAVTFFLRVVLLHYARPSSLCGYWKGVSGLRLPCPTALQMNPSQPPHKNAPVWPLEQSEAQAATEVLTSAPHFSQLECKAGLISLPLNFTVTAILWPEGRLLFAWHGWVLRVCQHPPAQNLRSINCPCWHHTGQLSSPGRATKSS